MDAGAFDVLEPQVDVLRHDRRSLNAETAS